MNDRKVRTRRHVAESYQCHTVSRFADDILCPKPGEGGSLQ